MTRYLLDTSALLTLRASEDGHVRVQKILREAQSKSSPVLLSVVSVTEFYYLVMQRAGPGEALKAHLQLKMLPLDIVHTTEEMALKAGEFKALHPISLADAYVAATAFVTQAVLVHKDPDFELMKNEIRLEALPYKV